tara:strand:- start:967 stop:1581 length:615 start_codon:yes stop_codon:yes gene_type:complete
MYQKNQSDFTTSAIDLLLASTLKAENIELASTSLASTVTGLPVSSTAVVYADGGTFTGSATKTALGTTAGALYQVTSDANGAVASITVINQGPNSALGKTIIFSSTALTQAFGAYFIGIDPAITGVITYTPDTAADLELPSTNFTQQPVALYVGVAGDITLTLASDSTEVKFVGVAAGTFLDVLCTSVNTAAAGTPASGLLALR